MDSLYREIITEFQKAAQNPANTTLPKMNSASYSGSPRKSYHIKNSVKYQKLKAWKSRHTDITFDEFINVLDQLNNGETSTERTSIGYLLETFPKFRKQLDLSKLENWISNLEGWAEIDSLCQRPFGKEDLESRWSEWKSLLQRLNQSTNPSKQRASLVLMIKTLRQTNKKKIITLAFENITNLLPSKNKLITKAISWILREMSRYHKKEVIEYYKKYEQQLPAIARREVKRKLETGRK